jgi:hypothetical protein
MNPINPIKNDRTLDQFLKNMAADHRPQLPTAGLIWWRAHLRRKQSEKERIERPVMLMLQLASAVFGAIVIASLADYFGFMQTALRSLNWFLLPLLIFAPLSLLLFAAWPKWSKGKK